MHLSETSLWRDARAMSFVVWLSIAQTVSWGIMFYGFAVFIKPLTEEFGWSKAEITGAFTLCLLISGFASISAGSILDRFGGRWLMTGASFLGVVLLLAASFTDTLVSYYMVWIGIGLVTASTFYPSGFAVVVATLGSRARQGVTLMTLIAGFASTVFIPLISLLIDQVGWRDSFLYLGLILLAVCVPIHAIVLAKERVPGAGSTGRPRIFTIDLKSGPVAAGIRNPAFWWIGTCFTANSFVMAGVTVHIIPLMLERGFTMATVIGTTAMIGPMQVSGRIFVTIFEKWINFRAAGLISSVFLLIGFALLGFAQPDNYLNFIFPIFYGASLGIITIVRALAVPELIGPEAYGALNGLLGFASAMALAATPVLLSWIWLISASYTAPLIVLSSVGLICLLSFIMAARRRV
ncbi:MAG: MFS transporter [Rhodospirillaceae bacterium]|jgi:MFS family permease|nr:MFS transporter [Rhodospirillaceae bacterium]MBT5191789.1 MFS transporter [Rhodospirillaceae bacterium]MBT5894480.1 MFS transporter [Rhodospirillaceae bacterium]MBT6431192.1 MFS transporter [Rhodospirillaceae bacterium]MBT7756295.1 MFS transporter [Rhodospirillaceae bacterium]